MEVSEVSNRELRSLVTSWGAAMDEPGYLIGHSQCGRSLTRVSCVEARGARSRVTRFASVDVDEQRNRKHDAEPEAGDGHRDRAGRADPE